MQLAEQGERLDPTDCDPSGICKIIPTDAGREESVSDLRAAAASRELAVSTNARDEPGEPPLLSRLGGSMPAGEGARASRRLAARRAVTWRRPVSAPTTRGRRRVA